MYKIVCVGGKLRGEEFVLNDGDNTLGRDPSENDIPLSVQGISKKHLNLTVNENVVYIEDLGSSNGTFVNGELVKRSSVENGDKIALPNVIFQLVHVKEKKVIVKKKILKEQEDDTEDDESFYGNTGGTMPTTPHGKVLFLFKNKVMPIFYKFNEEYEWRMIIGIFLGAFILISVYFIISPILKDSKRLLITEIIARAEHYANEVERLNARALEARNLDRLDTNFLEREPGVNEYELFDLEGRIVRPATKLNNYIKKSFSVSARTWMLNNPEHAKNKSYIKNLGDNRIGIAKSIMAYNVKLGREEAVGIIAIQFTPVSLQVGDANNLKAYWESVVITVIGAVLFFALLYFLTMRHFEEMKFQIEQVMRGKQKEIISKYHMIELTKLRNLINSLLQRIRELQNEDDGESSDLEDEEPYIETLHQFLLAAGGAAMVLTSEKKIRYLNPEAEDLTGIRESMAEGAEILDVARDQGFAATIIDICDETVNSQGEVAKQEWELRGENYSVCAITLFGRDSFSKGFFITFVKE